jgi:hypothetical protein
MESRFLAARSLLQHLFLQRANQAPWWFSIKDNQDEGGSLASFLGISTDQLMNLFKSASFAYDHGKTIKFKATSIQNFLLTINNSSGHDTSFLELSFCQVRKVQSYYLRIGAFKKGSKVFSANDQMLNPPKKHPSLSLKEKKHFAAEVTAILDVEVNKKRNQTIVAKATPDKPASSIPEGEHTRKDLCNTKQKLKQAWLRILLDDVLSKVVDPSVLAMQNFWQKQVDNNEPQHNILDILLQTVEKMRDKMEQDEKMKEAARDAAVATREILEDINPDDYPVLKQLNIGLTNDRQLQPLLRDIYKLQKKVKSVDLFQFSAYNDKQQNYVVVPTSGCLKQFKANASKTKWVDKMLDAVVNPMLQEYHDNNEEEDSEDEEIQAGTGKENVAQWVTIYLGLRYPDAFVQAAESLGMPIRSSKMDRYSAFAMWREANISIRAQRTIHRHFSKFFGWRFTVSEKEINEIALEATPVDPISETFEMDNQRFHYWWKRPNDVATNALVRHLRDTDVDPTVFDAVDIVVGFDHGQGALRGGLKVILRSPERKYKTVLSMQLGEVECKSDSSKFLAASLAPKINDCLTEMVRYVPGCATDGIVEVYREGGVNGPLYASALLDSRGRRSGYDVLVISLPLRVFVTGDLKFYSTILGKEGMSPFWCWLCQLSRQLWQPKGHQKGTLWSIVLLQTVAEGLRESDNKSCRGVVEAPLFYAIAVRRYVVPILHMTLGVINQLLKDLLDYLDLLLEDLPLDVREARQSLLKAQYDLDVKKQELRDWEFQKKEQLATLRLERQLLIRWLQMGEYETNEEKDQLIHEKLQVAQAIKDLEKEKKDMEVSKVVKRAVADGKRELKRVEAEYPKLARPLRARIEDRALIDHGIERPPQQGGELIGDKCRKLAGEKNGVIFATLTAMVGEEADRQGKPEMLKIQCIARCQATQKSMILFDTLFALLSKECEDVTEADKLQVQQASIKAVSSWRALGTKLITPKIHVCEDHVADQYRELNGLGDFREDFIEQLHQQGVKDNSRSKSFRDRARKFLNHSKWEHMSKNPKVETVIKKIKEEGKKRRRKTIEESGPQQRKRNCHQQRSEVLRDFVPVAQVNPNAFLMEEYKASLMEDKDL